MWTLILIRAISRIDDDRLIRLYRSSREGERNGHQGGYVNKSSAPIGAWKFN